MKTLAAILVEQQKPLEIDEVEVPAPGFGQVLVDVKASRICGTQLGEIDGVKGPDRWLPHLLGHEGGGIVREVGPEVTRVKPGDHVVLHWRPGAGIQARPAVYKRGSQTVNAGYVTTFQGMTVVSENRLTPIPEDVDFEVASLLADTLTTGFGAVTRDARIEIGESVIVIGVGGIGLGTVLGARLAGAHPIIGVDLYDHKLAKAKEYGATHVINSAQQNLAEAVLAITGGPVDAVFDGTGNPGVLETAWRLAGPRGRVLLVGVMRHDAKFAFNTLPLHFGKVLAGSEGGSSRPDHDIPRLLRMMADERFDPRGMVTHRCNLRDVNEAIACMRSGDAIHTVIHFED